MAVIPEVKPSKFPLLQRKALHELIVGVPTVVGAVGAGVNASTNLAAPAWLYPALIVGGGIGSIGIYLKGRRAHEEDQTNERLPPAEWLLAPLYTLHADLCVDFGFKHPASPSDLRITIHRVDWEHEDEGKRLEQAVEYVGGCTDDKPRRGRRFPLRAGVIGKCAKDGNPIYAHRTGEDIEAFRREMVDQWQFTKEEAKGLTDDRWSYAAYPILVEGKTQAGAVLYADTSKKGAFKHDSIQKKLDRWCVGFAEFLRSGSKGD